MKGAGAVYFHGHLTVLDEVQGTLRVRHTVILGLELDVLVINETSVILHPNKILH